LASLVDELLQTLREEKDGYDRLYDLAQNKRKAVIDRELSELTAITEKEQAISDRLKNLENRRVSVMKDMASVLGHDEEELTVTAIIALLSKQKDEQEALTKARDELINSATRMQFLNQQNRVLLEQAMEMVNFDLTLYKSMRQAPETANYGKDAVSTGELLGGGSFDFKQ
jgi:flagellar biosynthesis/type III secretory pathway chaperone